MKYLVRSFIGCAALAAVLAGLTAGRAEAQFTTASLRGRVTGADGTPIANARVTATNTQNGVARATETDAAGWYRLLGLQVGSYRVRAQAIGNRPQEKTGFELHLGDDLLVDFQLTAAAVEVAGVDVVAEQTPLVDPGKTGVSAVVNESQIGSLPANGRNFTDFLNLAPTYVKTPVFGSGATIGSVGGSRNSGSVMTIDGAQNTGSFFGGDPRGSDRLPIAFSIEAVKEFQVATNEYDVSKGGFVGGLINVVTKSGTNEFHGTAWEYFRSQGMTEVDFVNRQPAEFLSHQFGGSFGGPIIRDKAHFYVTVDRQARNAPFTAAGTSTVSTSNANLQRLDQIIRSVYGVDPGARDQVSIKTNEWVFFGRVDWALNDRHRLVLRDNLTVLDLTGDRVATTDYQSNGGPQTPKANSLVGNLFSNLSPTLFNEFRFQYSTDHKPRPPQVGYSQMRVRLGGQTVAFGADSILHYNNLEANTLEFADNLTYIRGPHTFQTGVEVLHRDYFNLFFNNGRGTYTFNWGNDTRTLDSLAARHASAFTRAIPVDSVSIPVADYTSLRYALFVQDKWQVNPRLFVNAGVRLDVPRVSGIPRNNPRLLDSFPQYFPAAGADSLTTGLAVPTQFNLQPRLGLTYDLFGDRRTVVRAGAGLFHGEAPFVYWSNMFLNTGRDQLNVVCDSTTAAAQNVTLNDTDVFDQVAPLGCGAASVPAANSFFFTQRDPVTGAEKSFRSPRTWKFNFGFDHAVTNQFSLGGEFIMAETRNNYSIRDINYRSNVTAVLTGEGGRPVIGTAPATGSNVRRIDPRFIQVLEHDNRSTGDYLAAVGSVRWRSERLDLSAAYTYSRARDDVSVSCCTSTTTYNLVEAGLNTNNQLDGNFGASDNDRPHKVSLSGTWRAPGAFQLSLIWQTYSGLPFTPKITSDADANGDGIRGNDRAYIPRNRQDISIDGNGGGAGFGSAFQQDSTYAVLDGYIRDNQCLATQRGRIAERNSCRSDGRSLVDIKILKEIALPRAGHRIELTLDIFNVLNGVDHMLADISDRFDGIINWDLKGWGNVTTRRNSLMRIRGFDPTNNRYVYEIRSDFGREDNESAFILSQFQLQLGARYRF